MAITYESIATTTLSSAQSSVTFSSISGSYTDLLVVANVKSDGNCGVILRFNSDSGSNYSYTNLWGDGTTAGSDRSSNVSEISPTLLDTGGPYNMFLHIMNYSNTTTYKTTLIRASGGYFSRVWAKVGLWRNTSAITTILLQTDSSKNFTSGSTFTLYGIKSA